MKRLRLKRHHLKHLAIWSAIWLIGIGVIGSLSWPSPLAEAATFSCLGQSTTYTVDAPVSVVTGKSLALNDITEIGNSLGFTITSVSATFDVTGASPASFTKTWTGSGSGTFTANMGNQTLVATGAAGSSVVVKVVSMTSHVQQLNQDFTCSVANGQMTANGPGQSLILASIPITAPASSGGGASTTKTKSPTAAPSQSPTATSPANPAQTTASPDSQTTTAGDIPVSFSADLILIDTKNRPMAFVQVILDSKPPKQTDAQGRVHFDNLTAGKHNLTVIGKGKQQTAQVNMFPSKTLVYRLAAIKPPLPVMLLAWTGLVLLLLIVSGAILLWRHHRKARQKRNNIV